MVIILAAYISAPFPGSAESVLASTAHQGGVRGGVPCAVPSPECPDAVAAMPATGGWYKWLVGRYRFNVEAPGFWTGEYDLNVDGLRGHTYIYQDAEQYASVNAILVQPDVGAKATLATAIKSSRSQIERELGAVSGSANAPTFVHDHNGSVGSLSFSQYRVSATDQNGNVRGVMRFHSSGRYVYVLSYFSGTPGDQREKRFFESFEVRKP